MQRWDKICTKLQQLGGHTWYQTHLDQEPRDTCRASSISQRYGGDIFWKTKNLNLAGDGANEKRTDGGVKRPGHADDAGNIPDIRKNDKHQKHAKGVWILLHIKAIKHIIVLDIASIGAIVLTGGAHADADDVKFTRKGIYPVVILQRGSKCLCFNFLIFPHIFPFLFIIIMVICHYDFKFLFIVPHASFIPMPYKDIMLIDNINH